MTDEQAGMTTEAAGMTTGRDAAPAAVTPGQRRFVSWTVDILVGVVVLNLFIEYLPGFVAESFVLSVLTAVLLKAMLVVIGGLEHAVSAYLKRRSGAVARIARIIAVWAILFVSKFVILEAVALVFRGSVQLGGFLQVVALIFALLIAERSVWAVYRRLGPRG